MPDIGNIIFASSLSGLGNYTVKDATTSIPKNASVAAFSFEDTTTSVAIEREDEISQIQFRYTDFDSTTFGALGDDVWRILSGYHILNGPNMDLITFYTVSSTTMTITHRFVNPTATPKDMPSCTFTARVFLFVAPFED